MTQANLNLDQVKLKEDALLKLNLPIKIELGIINHLEIRIPWLTIGSSPVEVHIQGLNLIISPQKQQDWQVIDIFDQAYLEEKLLAAITDIKSKLQKDENQGYLEKLATKVVDNLQITIQDVHIRFEDHFTSQQQYNFGICLKLLEVQTTNNQWIRKFVDRTQSGAGQNLFKLLKIEGFGLYLNPNDSMIVHQQTDDQLKRIQLMSAIVQNDDGHLQFMLSPMNLIIKMEYQTKPNKKANLSINLDYINITILKSQLKCLLKSFELVSEYRKVQNYLIKTRKFKFLRPLRDKIDKSNAKEWWRYAYNCIKKSNRAKNGSLKEFSISKSKLAEIRLGFIKSFKIYFKNSCQNKQLKQVDFDAFRYTLMSVDFYQIKEWVKQIIEPEVKIQQTQSQGQGFSNWLFGETPAEQTQVILTEEEIQELEKEINDLPVDINNKIMHTNLSLGIKEVSINMGFINDQNIVEGISFFQRDLLLLFKSQSFQETSFDMEVSISDLGVELFQRDQLDGGYEIQESVILSNKKIFPQSLEEQLRLKVRCKPEDLRNIEYDVNLTTLNINESQQSVAIDAIEDLREATSNQVYFLIYKKANRFRINIASPVLILPLSGDSDQLKPVWVLRLGDLQVEKTVLKEQDELVFSVLEDCWMKCNIQIKQKKARLLMVTEEQKAELDLKPKVILNCTTSDLKINLTHQIYNKLVNISKIFQIQKELEDQSQQDEYLIESKLQVLRNAKKIGTVTKRLDPTKIWENYYSILSGNYLYFYKDSNQKMPAAYFYLRGAHIEIDRADVGAQNNLVISSRFGECVLLFPTRNILQEWVFSTRQRINEIRIEDEEYQNTLEIHSNIQSKDQKSLRKKKTVNHETPQISLQFEMPLFKTVLIDEIKYYQDWVLLQFKQMTVINVTRKAMKEIHLTVHEISLIDLTMIVNSSLISQNRFNNITTKTGNPNALDIKMVSIQKNHPKYEMVDSKIDIQIDNLNVKFQPETFNQVLKFLKFTKSEKDLKLSHQSITQRIEQISQQQIDEEFPENISYHSLSQESQPQNQNHQYSCKSNKETLSLINVKMKNISITMLHQNYHMDLYRLESNFLEIIYETKSDHFTFSTNLKDMIIYDMTGYPYTINPRLFLQNPQNYKLQLREFVSIRNEDESQFGLMFSFLSFEGKQCELRKEGFSSRITMKIKPLTIEYFQESVMRLYQYFFEQFISSLTQTDPYIDYKAQYDQMNQKRTIRRDTLKKIPDLQQIKEIIEMNISIQDMSVKIPDRPDSQNYLYLTLQNLHVTQVLIQKAKRITINPEKKLLVQCFRIGCENVQIKFGEKSYITQEPFSIKVLFEKLSHSELLQRADPLLIEQASHIFINFDPVDLSFNQTVYTGILRCMDLNMNFQDMLPKEYYFIRHQNMEDYFKQLVGVIGMRIKLKFSTLNLGLKHLDDSPLSQLSLDNFGINMIKYMDFKNEMLIKIENFFISESHQIPRQTAKFANHKNVNFNEDIKINSNNYVVMPIILRQQQNEVFQSPHITKKKANQVIVNMTTNGLGEKDIKVGISGLKITIKPNVLMMVYYFFLNSFPQYEENSIDIPSSYNFDPEDSQKMDFSVDLQDSLICLQNKPGLKTICIQGKIFFELKKENVKARKNQIIKNILNELNNINIKLEDEDFELQNNFEKNLQIVENKYVWSMNVLMRDICPFVCSPSQLNIIDDFMKIKKRQLLTPFKLSYSSTLELDSNRAGPKKPNIVDNLIFGVLSESEIKLERVKMKMSLQDLHLLYQIITFANENVSKEYMQKLDKINEYVNRQGLDDKMISMQDKFDRSKTIKQDFGIVIDEVDESNDQMIDQSEDQDKFEEIFQNIQQQYDQSLAQQIQRLRSTTKAFSSLAHKYTSVTHQNFKTKQTIKAKQNQKTFYGKTQFNSNNNISEHFKTVYSKSNYREDKEQSESMNQTKNIQHFFEGSASVSKKRKLNQPLSPFYQYNTKSYNFQGSTKNMKQIFQEERKSGRSRYISHHNDQDDEDEFQDAKSELFYSAHEKNDQAEESKYATPLNAIDVKSINKEIQKEIERIDSEVQPQQRVEYKNCLENIFMQKSTIKSDGIQILFINDYDNAFCPILDIDIPNIQMETEQVCESSQTEIKLKKLRANYYNALLGDWEPFIENFEVTCLQNVAGQQHLMKVEFPKPININFTESCLESLISTYNSWMETPPYQYEDLQMRQRLLSSKISNNVEENKENNSSSNTGSINQEFENLTESMFMEEREDVRRTKQQSRQYFDNIEKVTPYSIRNLTNYKLSIARTDFVQRIDSQEDIANSVLNNRTSQNIYDIDPQEEVDYAIDYEKEATELLNNKQNRKQRNGSQSIKNLQSRHGTVDLSKMQKKNNQQLVNIMFDNFQPITNIDLNKIMSNKRVLVPYQDEENNATQGQDQSSFLVRDSAKSKKSRGKYELIHYDDEVLYDYYTNHDIQIQIRQDQEQMKGRLVPNQDLERGQVQEFSNGQQIESLLKLDEGKGVILDHQNGFYSYLTKKSGDIQESFDIVILPPISIKNALPTVIEVMGVIKGKETKDLDDQIFSFIKGEEKHFHIYTFQGDKGDELNLKVRMAGFNWAMLTIKKRDIFLEDKEFTIRDLEGNNLQLQMRISSKSAGINLIFYASTVVINHSHNKFLLHYDTINKQIVAGQENKEEFTIVNKDDPLVACINERYSKAIKIKTVGVIDEISIISSHNSNLRDSYQRQRKYEFVYLNYLTLVVDDDYIYTKIVQIQPKYVLVNNMKSPICVAQSGNELNSYEVLEPQNRREWVWADSNLEDEIVIKRQDVTIEHIYGENSEQSSMFMIPEEDRYKKWKWSKPITFKKLGMITVEIKKVENRFNNIQARKIIKVTQKKIDATTYVIFEDEDKKNPYYKIENTTNSASIWFVQDGFRFEDEGCKLVPKTSLPFAFIDPKGQLQLQCLIVVNDNDPLTLGRTLSQKDELLFNIDFEQIDSKQHFEYVEKDTGEHKKVHITVYTDGCTKIIRFSDNPLVIERQREKFKDNKTTTASFMPADRITRTIFQLNLREILISVISTIEKKNKRQFVKKRQEIATLSLQGLNIDKIQNQEFYHNNIRIKSIQVDNQSQMNPLFPTILQPRVYRGQEDVDMIQVQINMRIDNPEITYIDEIDCKFSGIIIKCDDKFMGYALSFGYGVVELLKKNITGTHPIFIHHIEKPSSDFQFGNGNHLTSGIQLLTLDQKQSEDMNYQGVVSIPQKQQITLKQKAKDLRESNTPIEIDQEIEEIYKSWLIKTIASQQKRIYINSCFFSALEIELSFLARKSFQLGEKEDSLQLQNIMNWWGLALINIDEAPISIKAFKETQKIDMQEDIINMILEHYQGGFKKNIINLIGSTELLGNPRKLFRTIGAGLNDFIHKPLENRDQGALQVIKGGLIGTGSLLKNTIEGSFGYIQSMTGSVSKGLLLMSMDREYLSIREEQLLTEKPKNIVEGVGFGLSTALNSIYSGITGVFIRPYREGKKDGLKGALIGTYSGISGVFLKPFSGGLDLISKSTEGVKNTVKIFEAKLFKDRRRLPRPIYGYNQQIKSYNTMDAYIIMRILYTVKDGVFENTHYIETIKYQEGERALFLIICEEHLILMDARQKAVWWNVNPQNILHIDKLQNGLILRFRQKYNYKTQEVIEINNKQQLEKIYERLKVFEKPI
eukprot:403346093